MLITHQQIAGEIVRQLGLDYEASVSSDREMLYLSRVNSVSVYRINIVIENLMENYEVRPSVSGKIGFNAVESILDKWFKKYHLSDQPFTVRMASREQDIKIRDPRLEIRSLEDVASVIPFLKVGIYEDVFPFFEKYDRLEKVYNHLKGLELEEEVKFLCRPVPIRKMIIYALFKDADFKPFSERILAAWKERSSKPNFARYYQFMPDLYEELKVVYES